jgi:chromosome segregation ATPase
LNWTELILPIVLAIIAASPGVIALFRGRSKEKADVAKAITEAAGELIEDYQNRLERLEKLVGEQAEKILCQEAKISRQARQIDIQADRIREQADKIRGQADRIQALEAERDEFSQGVLSLCAQIRELGYEPVWEPESPEDQ